MKNLLILIVAAAVFLHFYPQPKLERWFIEQKEFVLSSFSDATDTKVRLKSDKVYQDIEPHFAQFNTQEEKYVKEITSTRAQVVEFHSKYCGTQGKRTPKLHMENQKLVCKTMDKYAGLF